MSTAIRAGSGLAMAKTPSRLFRKDPARYQGPYGKNPAPRERDRVHWLSPQASTRGQVLVSGGDYMSANRIAPADAVVAPETSTSEVPATPTNCTNTSAVPF